MGVASSTAVVMSDDLQRSLGRLEEGMRSVREELRVASTDIKGELSDLKERVGIQNGRVTKLEGYVQQQREEEAFKRGQATGKREVLGLGWKALGVLGGIIVGAAGLAGAIVGIIVKVA